MIEESNVHLSLTMKIHHSLINIDLVMKEGVLFLPSQSAVVLYGQLIEVKRAPNG